MSAAIDSMFDLAWSFSQPRRAASIAAMSIFLIVIIASNARLAATEPGSVIAVPLRLFPGTPHSECRGLQRGRLGHTLCSVCKLCGLQLIDSCRFLGKGHGRTH